MLIASELKHLIKPIFSFFKTNVMSNANASTRRITFIKKAKTHLATINTLQSIEGIDQNEDAAKRYLSNFTDTVSEATAGMVAQMKYLVFQCRIETY